MSNCSICHSERYFAVIDTETTRDGSKYQSTSAFNEYASEPPIIVTSSGEFVGYLTANEFKTYGYTITQLEKVLKKAGQ